MPITFRYKKFQRADGHHCYGPWVPLTVIGKKDILEIVFLLDSGADYTVIPLALAEILGLDLSKPKEKTKGVGGEIETIPTRMNVNLKGPHENYKLSIPTHVILNKDSDVPPLLGRAGFFNEFHILIDQRRGKITFSRSQKHGT